jgi:NAD(P)H-hydrate epimerase
VAKVVSVEQMVAIEKQADADGLSYGTMMENAGRSVAEIILQQWPQADSFRVLILVGPGNNGGDGLVAGYYLAQAGAEVTFYLLKERSRTDENFLRITESQAEVVKMADDVQLKQLTSLIHRSDLIIDGLLGTGFSLPLRGEAKKLLRKVDSEKSKSSRKILIAAIDCPSGMDCDTGEVAGEAVSADLTITLAAAKRGMLQPIAMACIGKLVVGDIGLGGVKTEMSQVALEMMDIQTAREWLPARPQVSHKGTYGRVLIVAGSMNYPGAAALAAMGAYRSGVGLVTLAVPEPIYTALVGVVPEATWILLPHSQGAITSNAVDVLTETIEKAQALLIGPGFGLDHHSQQFLTKLFGGKEAGERLGFINAESPEDGYRLPPLVLDADALKLIAQDSAWPGLIPAKSVLTPHPGEMSVMCGVSVAQIQDDRVGIAEYWAKEWGHVLVLKGANTVVASPKGAVMVIPVASSALAKAGTGDVLAGVIASLIAQGLKPYLAACLGAYLHARAGVLAAELYGTPVSVSASDVADALAEAFAELQ